VTGLKGLLHKAASWASGKQLFGISKDDGDMCLGQHDVT